MEAKENNLKGYILGTLGSMVGGMIATLPWILCYVYANMMYSILAIFIAIGAFKGYELCKGKIDKKVPIIIAVVSLVAITIATLVIIPHLLILKEYGSTNMEAFKLLYSFDEFKTAIIQDYIYSLLFTVLGTSGIIGSIKRSIESGDAKVQFNKPLYSPTDEEIQEIKAVFEKVGAFDKEHTINKDDLMSKVKGKENVLKFLQARGIVRRNKDNYFYDLDVEENPNKRVLKITFITFGAVFGIIFLLFILVSMLG